MATFNANLYTAPIGSFYVSQVFSIETSDPEVRRAVVCNWMFRSRNEWYFVYQNCIIQARLNRFRLQRVRVPFWDPIAECIDFSVHIFPDHRQAGMSGVRKLNLEISQSLACCNSEIITADQANWFPFEKKKCIRKWHVMKLLKSY